MYIKKAGKCCSAELQLILLTGMSVINNMYGAVFIYYTNALQWGLDHAGSHICNLKEADKGYAHRPKAFQVW